MRSIDSERAVQLWSVVPGEICSVVLDKSFSIGVVMLSPSHARPSPESWAVGIGGGRDLPI